MQWTIQTLTLCLSSYNNNSSVSLNCCWTCFENDSTIHIANDLQLINIVACVLYRIYRQCKSSIISRANHWLIFIMLTFNVTQSIFLVFVLNELGARTACGPLPSRPVKRTAERSSITFVWPCIVVQFRVLRQTGEKWERESDFYWPTAFASYQAYRYTRHAEFNEIICLRVLCMRCEI